MPFVRLCSFAAIFSLASLLSIHAFAQAVTPLPIVKFSKAVNFVGYAAVFQAIADLNGDGHLDVVVAEDQLGVGVMLGNGDGTFQAPVQYSTGGFTRSPIAIADLDGDGKPDIVVIDSDVNEVAVLKGNGDGSFQSPVKYDTGGTGAQDVAVGDLNGDGKPDIVLANAQMNNTGSVGVLLNNGNGTFQAVVNYGRGGLPSDSIAVGDVNGDGHPDVVICDKSSNLVGVLEGNSNGTLQGVVTYPAPNAMSVAIHDLNGDGHPDLVTGQYGTGAINVLLNDGKGGFQPVVSYTFTASSAWSVAVQDVNGDGIPDVVVASAFRCPTYCKNGSVNVLVGNGDGTFLAPTTYGSGGPNARSIAIGDINEDGRPDLLVVNGNTAVVAGLLNNLKVGMTMALSSSSNPVQVNHPFTVTAAFTSELPVDGKVVSFYVSGVLAGTSTTKNGIATFTTTISQARTHTIKVTYPGGPFQKAISGSYKQGVVP